MGYQLITNNIPRQLQSLLDLPEKLRADFDYLSEDDVYSARFVQYRGEWYDAFDTQRIELDNSRAHPIGWAHYCHPGEPMARFDSVVTDTYFSGVLFRFTDDESVIVARFYS